MPTINQLPTVTQVSGGDQFPLFLPSQGDARRCSVTTMMAFFATNMGDLAVNTVQAIQYLKVPAVPFASLTDPVVAGAGARATCSNSNTTTFNAAVAGGGANVIPVFSDGTIWRVG